VAQLYLQALGSLFIASYDSQGYGLSKFKFKLYCDKFKFKLYCDQWSVSKLVLMSAFISPRNRVVQLYPQALASLFIASYNSQCYGLPKKLKLYCDRWSVSQLPHKRPGPCTHIPQEQGGPAQSQSQNSKSCYD
jgi:hypothetical protein